MRFLRVTDVRIQPARNTPHASLLYHMTRRQKSELTPRQSEPRSV
jgi:hypothetical protein